MPVIYTSYGDVGGDKRSSVSGYSSMNGDAHHAHPHQNDNHQHHEHDHRDHPQHKKKSHKQPQKHLKQLAEDAQGKPKTEPLYDRISNYQSSKGGTMSGEPTHKNGLDADNIVLNYPPNFDKLMADMMPTRNQNQHDVQNQQNLQNQHGAKFERDAMQRQAEVQAVIIEEKSGPLTINTADVKGEIITVRDQNGNKEETPIESVHGLIENFKKIENGERTERTDVQGHKQNGHTEVFHNGHGRGVVSDFSERDCTDEGPVIEIIPATSPTHEEQQQQQKGPSFLNPRNSESAEYLNKQLVKMLQTGATPNGHRLIPPPPPPPPLPRAHAGSTGSATSTLSSASSMSASSQLSPQSPASSSSSVTDGGGAEVPHPPPMPAEGSLTQASSTNSLAGISITRDELRSVTLRKVSTAPTFVVPDHPLMKQVRNNDLIEELKQTNGVNSLRRLRDERVKKTQAPKEEEIEVKVEDFSADNFLEKIPAKDVHGKEVPLWKRQMLAKKEADKAKKEEEERVKKEAEENRLKLIPKWKRELMQRKENEIHACPPQSASSPASSNGMVMVSKETLGRKSSVLEEVVEEEPGEVLLEETDKKQTLAPWQQEVHVKVRKYQSNRT